MKKTILITIAICFTSLLIFAQNDWTRTNTTLKTPYHVVVGDNTSTTLWTRHINGKMYNSNLADGLFLNYGTGKNVYVGSANNKADLIVRGETISQRANGFRIAFNGRGVFHRNDGNNYYMLITNSGNPYGTFNTLRPFRINNTHGSVHLNNGTMDVLRNKVGINQTLPKSDLHIGEQMTFRSPQASGGLGQLGINWYWANGAHRRILNAPSSAIAFPSNGDIYFRGANDSGAAGTPITSVRHNMIIYNNGGIKINGSTTRNALEVVGTGRFYEVLVENDWSDYVFYDDYKLPSINEQLAFVEDNGHLANFQSEEEMDGKINIGDVTKRQQQTIEELMLYIGQLNEVNNSLVKRVEALEIKLNE